MRRGQERSEGVLPLHDGGGARLLLRCGDLHGTVGLVVPGGERRGLSPGTDHQVPVIVVLHSLAAVVQHDDDGAASPPQGVVFRRGDHFHGARVQRLRRVPEGGVFRGASNGGAAVRRVAGIRARRPQRASRHSQKAPDGQFSVAAEMQSNHATRQLRGTAVAAQYGVVVGHDERLGVKWSRSGGDSQSDVFDPPK